VNTRKTVVSSLALVPLAVAACGSSGAPDAPVGPPTTVAAPAGAAANTAPAGAGADAAPAGAGSEAAPAGAGADAAPAGAGSEAAPAGAAKAAPAGAAKTVASPPATTTVASAGTPAAGRPVVGRPAPVAAGPKVSSGGPAVQQDLLAVTAVDGTKPAYEQQYLIASAGEVTIRFTNNSPLRDNVTILDSTGRVLGATPTFSGGTQTLRVRLGPGSYTFYSSVPGQAAAGMKGKLTVT
jgi:plastocyanin